MEPSRAGAVKIGRCADLNSCCEISRPHLDGPEHGGIVVCVGIDHLVLVAALVVDG